VSSKKTPPTHQRKTDVGGTETSVGKITNGLITSKEETTLKLTIRWDENTEKYPER
jgi:hypothetical protein